MSDWVGVYMALHESDMLCSNNPVQACSASTGRTKMDPLQSVPFCFTCNSRNPIGNALKPCFDNRMASMQLIEVDRLFGI